MAVPFPVPVPLVMATQLNPFVVLHAQLVADAVTVMLPEPPAAPKDWLAGEIENVHGASAPAWSMEKVCPATVRVPFRGVVLVFAETE